MAYVEGRYDRVNRAKPTLEALASLGSMVGLSVPAGIYGLGNLASGKDLQTSINNMQDIYNYGYTPKSEEGISKLQDIAEGASVLAAPSEWVGDQVNPILGPEAATAAEIFLDPINLIPGYAGMKIAGKNIKSGYKSLMDGPTDMSRRDALKKLAGGAGLVGMAAATPLAIKSLMDVAPGVAKNATKGAAAKVAASVLKPGVGNSTLAGFLRMYPMYKTIFDKEGAKGVQRASEMYNDFHTQKYYPDVTDDFVTHIDNIPQLYKDAYSKFDKYDDVASYSTSNFDIDKDIVNRYLEGEPVDLFDDFIKFRVSDDLGPLSTEYQFEDFFTGPYHEKHGVHEDFFRDLPIGSEDINLYGMLYNDIRNTNVKSIDELKNFYKTNLKTMFNEHDYNKLVAALDDPKLQNKIFDEKFRQDATFNTELNPENF